MPFLLSSLTNGILAHSRSADLNEDQDNMLAAAQVVECIQTDCWRLACLLTCSGDCICLESHKQHAVQAVDRTPSGHENNFRA